jgi:hypothetical protein
MNRSMRSALLGVGLIVCASGSLQAGWGHDCQHVGGSISTNFLDTNTTSGTATGDLAGGIGVTILSLNPNTDGTLTFRNQHHWVTTSGDTLLLDDAEAVGFPSGISGLYSVSYTKGLTLTGGTGRFAHAKGELSSFGAVNTTKGEVVLRYEGQVCYGKDQD